MNVEMLVIAAVVIAFTAIAMTVDLKSRRIPNWLTLPTLAGALVFHGLVSGLAGLGTALGGFAIGFGLLFILWLIGGGGGGDVKLMGALGAWLGAPLTLIVFILSTLIAVIFSVAFRLKQLINNRSLATANAQEATKAPNEEKTTARLLIPFAVPVAFATWLVMCGKILSMTASQ